MPLIEDLLLFLFGEFFFCLCFEVILHAAQDLLLVLYLGITPVEVGGQ